MKHLKLFEKFINEYQHDEDVWIHIKFRGEDVLCTLIKMDNKWIENHESGPQLPQFGRSHLGSTIDDVVRNLNDRYDSAELISEEDAFELI